MQNLSPEELQAIYRDIHARLITPFPDGTVEARGNDSDSKYIPVQPYIHRLEKEAGVFWSWKLTGQPRLFEVEDQVMVTGTLRIVDAEREGIGFSKFERFNDTGKIKNIKYAILSAASDALRNACDLFEMGWADLAPYRKWASNPGVELLSNDSTERPHAEPTKSGRICLMCANKQVDAAVKLLTMDDEAHLADLQIKQPYHKLCLPEHLERNAKKALGRI